MDGVLFDVDDTLVDTRQAFGRAISAAAQVWLPDLPDTPLKYYSSGMEARLAFSVAVCLQPDILLLDEVLAVGDQTFRERCLERLRQYHARGGTLILVSHELEQLRDLCTRGVWLDEGRIVTDGPICCSGKLILKVMRPATR